MTLKPWKLYTGATGVGKWSIELAGGTRISTNFTGEVGSPRTYRVHDEKIADFLSRPENAPFDDLYRKFVTICEAELAKCAQKGVEP
jgi:hypothetical protein